MPPLRPGFANFSKNLCWLISFIWLVVSVLSFTGESQYSAISGFLWLAGAFVFAISAMSLSRGKLSKDSDARDEQAEE